MLHANILHRRQSLVMTQRELADRASNIMVAMGHERYMDRDVISKIERGVRQVTALELRAIALALKCTTDELFDPM